MNIKDIQKQFGSHTEKYVRSSCFATGESLDKIIELLQGTKINRALDVATGGGHTAMRLCSFTEHVVAGDITGPMLKTARQSLVDNGISNVCYCQHDAHVLPFPDRTFDLVTCRIAPHHFTDVICFLEEVVRVAQIGAMVGIIDNSTPVDPLAARHINAFERLRDKSHNHTYTYFDWNKFFDEVGLKIEHLHEYRKTVNFRAYCDRKAVSALRRTQLKVMLVHAPKAALASLKPRNVDGEFVFDLQETLIVGRLIVG